MHFTVRLAGHDWLTWGSLQKVLLYNGFLGRVLICGRWYHRPVFGWRDILFPCYINFESCYGDLLGFLNLPAGVSIELGTLVGFRSGSGQRLYSPYLHNFFCNAYGASPVCQGYLGIFLFYLLPPGGPQLGGRCFSFVAVLDGAGGIYIQLVFKAPLCITLTISDQKHYINCEW